MEYMLTVITKILVVVRFPPPKTVRLRFICALPDFLKIRSGEVPELVYIVARKQHTSLVFTLSGQIPLTFL